MRQRADLQAGAADTADRSRARRIFYRAGLPTGLFNVVDGFAETGRLLIRHPKIQKISLTGSVPMGKAVAAEGAASLKRVSLELGGKSCMIICEDAEFDSAVSGAMLGNFYSSGEICSNGTRVFVHRSLYPRFLDTLQVRTSHLIIGDPLDPATQIGALISPEHMEKVLAHIRAAEAAGARLIAVGHRRLDGPFGKGCFVEPTIFADCLDQMSIAQAEIFGPVMAVFAFDTEDEVIARANATPYGLSAAVFTTDLARTHRIIANLQAGTCWTNHYSITPVELPFGGMKQSGYGRENNHAAIESYTQIIERLRGPDAGRAAVLAPSLEHAKG
ncbi:MAG TPA: aldehyde dehydrogenase family protein [Acetobacteraceae bacterium]|nr:aldehyde dehydrogenase family protein [Acetobacteraceae bacterium]